MPRQPLAEVFGFPIDNQSPQAQRHRRLKLCPFNNRVPNCTKIKPKTRWAFAVSYKMASRLLLARCAFAKIG